jgi:hypothetical protein
MRPYIKQKNKPKQNKKLSQKTGLVEWLKVKDLSSSLSKVSFRENSPLVLSFLLLRMECTLLFCNCEGTRETYFQSQ